MAKPNATTVFILMCLILATTLVVMIIAPFAGALFAAAVVAGVLFPVQGWLAGKLGGRAGLAAGALTLGVSLVVVAPVTLLAVQGVEQLSKGVDYARSTLNEKGLEGAIATLPGPLQGAARTLSKRVPPSWLPEQTEPRGDDGGATAATSTAPVDVAALAGWIGRGAHWFMGFAVDVGVLVLALYFLLAQGRHLVEWISAVIPLESAQSREMVERLRDVNRAVFVATLGSALVQTVIAAVGYLIAGVTWIPAALLLTFVASLIPVVGGAAVVVLVGALAWAQGDTGYGIFLIGWGLVFVGLADNVVKPLMTERGLKLPSSIIFFAMLGGMTVFGPMGVVAGPLVVAFFITILGLMRDQGWIKA